MTARRVTRHATNIGCQDRIWNSVSPSDWIFLCATGKKRIRIAGELSPRISRTRPIAGCGNNSKRDLRNVKPAGRQSGCSNWSPGTAVEAILAERLETLLDAGELPDLEQLRDEFAPRQTGCPQVAVDLPFAALHDGLLDHEVAT
jgi:hypothetical protein